MAKTSPTGKCEHHAALIAKLDHLSAIAEFSATLPGICFTFEMHEIGPQYTLYYKSFNNRLPCLLGYSQQEIEHMGDDFLTTIIFEDDCRFVGQMFHCLWTGSIDAVFNTYIRLRPFEGGILHMVIQSAVSQRYADGRPRQIKGNGWLVEDNTYLHHQMYSCLLEDIKPEVLEMINSLTEREQDVLKCLLLGHPAKEIAAELNLGIHTVYSYTKNIHETFEITNKESLLSFALKNNLFIWLKAVE